MKISELNIASFSDVHLGHPVMTTEHVVMNLRRAFPDNADTAKLDIIFIVGDFFDRNLTLSAEVNYVIRPYIRDLLLLCKKHNIKLRVLKGTPSHDWEQSKLFTHINDLMDIQADVKYFNVLDVEYIDEFGINILYLPDEWRYSTAQTQNEIVSLLAEKQLQQVDFTVMHGQFKHQLPKVTHDKIQFHDADFFLSITKYFVFVGHIHFQSQFARILSSGSFDRSAHGEEKPKGHYRLVVRQNDRHDIYFIENKYALKFITIDVTDLSAEVIYETVSKYVTKYPKGSHFRLLSKKDNSLNNELCGKLRVLYPEFNWTDKIKTPKQTQKVLQMVDTREQESRVVLSPTNIEQLLMARIQVKHPDKVMSCQKLLKELMNE